MNWFKAADVSGVVIHANSSGTVVASVSLGNLPSVSSFSKSGSGCINIDEANGLNLTRFLLLPCVSDYYRQRFASLTVDVTIDGTVWTMPVLTAGTSFPEENGWADSKNLAFQRMDWQSLHLGQGEHTIRFDVYGQTQLVVGQDISVSFQLVVELSA